MAAISRRDLLTSTPAVAVAAALPTAAVAIPVALASERTDSVIALYAEWEPAHAETVAASRRLEAALDVVAERYGAPRPRTLMFEPLPDRPLHYVEFDEDADRVTRNGECRTSIGTREELKANLEAERRRWREIEDALGVPALEEAKEAGDRRLGHALDRLRETPATSPAGAALKLQAALMYITSHGPGGSGEHPEDLEWKGFYAVIRDLDAMEAGRPSASPAAERRAAA